MAGEQEPKIIVDTDWKSQAQAEKEKLAATSRPASPAAAAGQEAPAAGAGAGPGGAEKVQFQDIVGMLTTQAVLYLGGFPDPKTGQAMISLEYAKLHIDMLAVLQEKTKGNLSPAEEQLLSRSVNELRLEFVEISKHVAKAVQEGRIKSVAAGSAGGIAAPGAGGVIGSAGPGGPSIR